jgi:membrane-associated phospholipid phosphatase
LKSFLFSFRPEELASLALFAPMAWALGSIAANGGGMAPTAATANYPDAFARLVTLAGSVVIFLYVVRMRPHWTFARDVLPFLFCANVYVNLHDMIAFFGAPDITEWLHRADVALFGVEPTIWAQRFQHPLLTDFFTFSYWLFYVLPPLLGFLLYLRGKGPAFRETLVSIVFCLYLGYVGYVMFPAGPPRYAIAPEVFGAPLAGAIRVLDESRAATAAVPLTAKGAFPSLHCGVMFLAMLLAWRHLRWFFPVMLFFGMGLILGTVYLRHHWVVDILAGIATALVADRLTPPIERWWEARARRHHAAPGTAYRDGARAWAARSMAGAPDEVERSAGAS